MLIVTTNEIPGFRILAVQGEVMGLTVRSRDAATNWVAGWRAIGGGEIPEFTQMLYEARMQVMGRMVDEAQRRGANGIVAMRFDASEIATQWTEICAYGTAVVIEAIPDGQEGATPQSAELAARFPRRAGEHPAPGGAFAPPADVPPVPPGAPDPFGLPPRL
ncbi:YbjQ family protein [Agrococcus sp. KRD186]|uniref:YbjQ family protein n=1 Tax=Agrococcus sp. KRD186 TaxID=2729730 RepID=UPI0019D24443|nr:YbjQ family protein [Agrococcus sp. KRD186]